MIAKEGIPIFSAVMTGTTQLISSQAPKGQESSHWPQLMHFFSSMTAMPFSSQLIA